MYWCQLKDLKTKNIAKIVLILGDDKPQRKFGNIRSIYRSFDFEKYFKAQNYERMRIILNLLHKELLALCDEQELNKEKIESAYKYCIDNHLEHKWLFKDRYFRSLDSKHYGAMECYWGTDKFTVTGIIFDKKKNEKFRQLLVEKKPYLGDFIYYSTCGWDDDKFFLQSKENERWEISSMAIPDV